MCGERAQIEQARAQGLWGTGQSRRGQGFLQVRLRSSVLLLVPSGGTEVRQRSGDPDAGVLDGPPRGRAQSGPEGSAAPGRRLSYLSTWGSVGHGAGVLVWITEPSPLVGAWRGMPARKRPAAPALRDRRSRRPALAAAA
jgi:hypothetical protein